VPNLRLRIRACCTALGALAALIGVLAAVGPASAGILDFFFGQQRPQAQQPPGRTAPAPARLDFFGIPLGPPGATIELTPGGSGQYAAYCVRLCDGRYFPMQGTIAHQSAQVCQNLCPASKTKVVFGTDIAYAAAADGVRYDQLPNAFAYRQKLVPGCSCNGKDFGIANMRIEDDPTLVPGDIVSTKEGLMRYTGYSKRMFTPIALPPQPGKRQASSQFPPLPRPQ
jgi:Protein of unknown function (DUF2865)